MTQETQEMAQVAQALKNGCRYGNDTVVVYLSLSGCYVAWPKNADPYEMSEQHAVGFIMAHQLERQNP